MRYGIVKFSSGCNGPGPTVSPDPFALPGSGTVAVLVFLREQRPIGPPHHTHHTTHRERSFRLVILSERLGIFHNHVREPHPVTAARRPLQPKSAPREFAPAYTTRIIRQRLNQPSRLPPAWPHLLRRHAAASCPGHAEPVVAPARHGRPSSQQRHHQWYQPRNHARRVNICRDLSPLQ